MNQNSYTSNKPFEEIDLTDIIMQLWRSKSAIIAFICIFLVLSVIYLFMVKEEWSSSAIITVPDSGQIANYNNSMNVLYMQNSSDLPSAGEVQQRFFSRFNSLLTALSEELKNQEKQENLNIEQVVKGQSVPLKVSYTAETAEEAQKILGRYLQNINQQVIDELNDDLTISINVKLDFLKESLDTQLKVAKEKQKQRLDVLNQALKVAEQTKIENLPVQQAESLSEDTLYLLGTDALSSIIKNEATRPLPLSDYYFQTRQSYLAIKALKANPDTLFSFRYVMKPNIPFYRDSPKRGLTLILAALLGGILGSGYVLGRNALRNYKPTTVS